MAISNIQGGNTVIGGNGACGAGCQSPVLVSTSGGSSGSSGSIGSNSSSGSTGSISSSGCENKGNKTRIQKADSRSKDCFCSASDKSGSSKNKGLAGQDSFKSVSKDDKKPCCLSTPQSPAVAQPAIQSSAQSCTPSTGLQAA